MKYVITTVMLQMAPPLRLDMESVGFHQRAAARLEALKLAGNYDARTKAVDAVALMPQRCYRPSAVSAPPKAKRRQA